MEEVPDGKFVPKGKTAKDMFLNSDFLGAYKSLFRRPAVKKSVYDLPLQKLGVHIMSDDDYKAVKVYSQLQEGEDGSDGEDGEDGSDRSRADESDGPDSPGTPLQELIFEEL